MPAASAAEPAAEPATLHPLRRLLRYASAHRRTVAVASTWSVLNKIFDLAPPFLIGAAVDVVVQKEHSLLASLGVVQPRWQLLALAAATIVIWTLESLFEYVQAIDWRNLAQSLQHELRLDAFAHVQTLEMARFEDRSTGVLLATLNDDVNQLERFLDGGANDLIQLATTAVVIGAAFFMLSPQVAWVAILPVPFVIWGSLAFQRRIAPRYAAVRDQNAALSGHLATAISGIATIKSFAAERFEAERIGRESERYRQTNRLAIRLSSAFSPLIRMVIVVGFLSALLLGGLLTIDGRLSVGAYSVMVFLTQRLLWPFTRLGQVLDLYQRAMASTRRILDLLDTQPAVVSGEAPMPTGQVRGEIVFDRVTFAYHAGHPVLRNLDLRIPAASTAAIVGMTGSGKSTIVKLLLRFYESGIGECEESGRITIDGRDIRSVRMDDLRRAVALVSQDVFLFHGTVRENIAYGLIGALDDPKSRNEPGAPFGDGLLRAVDAVPLERVIEAALAAEAHEFVVRLPHGYDTLVGERGQKLSGGQRQRIAMARAVLKDAPILVLDEATSSVDNETEAAIQRSLARLAVGRTVIVIAHRLSTVRHADCIHVLSEGGVVERGTHDELVERDGIYAALWRIQTGAGAVGTLRR
ncbi:MAG: ABC transporter ATP-binding protein [Phycisphaerales bacterium]|nr:ABC transporter ATP-binding protein [Phycisphaerales bacterium]